MKNVKQIWQETAKQLEKVYDQHEAENISYLLLEDAFNIKRADVISEENRSVSLEKLDKLLIRLLQSEPIQYVTGIAYFYGRKFQLAPGALIPRPETEELCELIIRENKTINPRILEVGVGSGCIAITLSAELKGKVFATDISNEALTIANKNADLLKYEVTLLRSNILEENLPESNLDILVSNPPYIPVGDRHMMHNNVLKYEPEEALFVPDNDPIVFYKRIAEKGIESLKKGGRLYFEIHERFGAEVVAFLKKLGYSENHIYQDMQGKDRMISAVKA